MELAWVLAVSVALGMDAFSCSLAFGLLGIRKRKAAHLVLTVALFHVFMPLIGLWAGKELGTIFGNLVTGIGTVILLYLGLKMLLNARGSKDCKQESVLPNLEGFGLYLIAGSVSIDALSVGFSLGTFVSRIFSTTLIMGFMAGLMTAAGIFLGCRIGTILSTKAEIIGGIILIIIGIKTGLSIVS
ncbi:MAG: manganese efflux pump [Peptococcaceae bacterium]|nr:manganese efflux pump [Peptococcaceae bacterium]